MVWIFNCTVNIMNASTIIAIIAVTGLVIVAVIGAINNRKKGNSCCGCSMKDCCRKAEKL